MSDSTLPFVYGDGRVRRLAMNGLKQILRKARGAVIRRGVLAQDAEDLVQEAFLRVEAFGRREGAPVTEGRVVVAAVNLSIDAARRRRIAPFIDLDDTAPLIADETPAPDEILRARSKLRHAAKGLERLPERTRRLLLARRIDGLSYAQIAEKEGMSVAAVEKHVARATVELTKWMDQW